MSAEAAQSSETMQRENAFVIGVIEGDKAGERREREESEFEAERLAEARRTIEANARQGLYTRAKAKRLGVDTIQGFKPLCAPYLKTEHLFERIDEEEYEHPLYGKVSGFQYGPCTLCGKTLDELAKLPQQQKPNLFLCMEKHQKAVALGYGNKNNYAKAKQGGGGKQWQGQQGQAKN
jgi:hypothetical protein